MGLTSNQDLAATGWGESSVHGGLFLCGSLQIFLFLTNTTSPEQGQPQRCYGACLRHKCGSSPSTQPARGPEEAKARPEACQCPSPWESHPRARLVRGCGGALPQRSVPPTSSNSYMNPCTLSPKPSLLLPANICASSKHLCCTSPPHGLLDGPSSLPSVRLPAGLVSPWHRLPPLHTVDGGHPSSQLCPCCPCSLKHRCPGNVSCKGAHVRAGVPLCHWTPNPLLMGCPGGEDPSVVNPDPHSIFSPRCRLAHWTLVA